MPGMNIFRLWQLVWVACMLASPSLLAGNPEYSYYFREPAVVFNSTSLVNDQLPGIIQSAHFPAVFRNEINLHCISLRGHKDTALVYLPQSQTCLTLDDLRRTQGREKTAGMNRRPGFETEYLLVKNRLQSDSLGTIQPAPPVGTVCSCDSNAPPEVGVDTGENQAAGPGDPVLIEYSATDVDSEVLTDIFTYQFNGGPVQQDLPTGLARNCTVGAGTLSCTVTGSAPLVSGFYAIRLVVTDNLSSGFATAFLTVLPEVIFLDGFETRQ